MACSWRALSAAIDEIRVACAAEERGTASAEVENSVALAVGIANQTVWNGDSDYVRFLKSRILAHTNRYP
jgi:hypothetical protein